MRARWEERAATIAIAGLVVTWAAFVVGFLAAHSYVKEAWQYQLDTEQQTFVALGFLPVAAVCWVALLHVLAKRWSQLHEARELAIFFGSVGFAWLVAAGAIFAVLWLLRAHWNYEVEDKTKVLLTLAALPIGFVALAGLSVLAISRSERGVRAEGEGHSGPLRPELFAHLDQRYSAPPSRGNHSEARKPGWFRYSDPTSWTSARSPEAVQVPADYRQENGVLKRLMNHYVFGTQALVNQQHGHRRVVRELFDIYLSAVRSPSLTGVLPDRYREHGCSTRAECARLAADIVSAMTEDQAMAIHARLAGLTPGHVLDRIVG